MKPPKEFLVAILVLTEILVSTHTAKAGCDMFLKVDTIAGESSASNHLGEIDITSFSQSHSRSNGAPQVSLKDFTFEKPLDKSSPKLAEACAKGEPIPEVHLTCRKAGSTNEYLNVKFTLVVITSYQIGGSCNAANPIPTESVSFKYETIKWTYEPQDANGNPTGPQVTGSWPPGL